MMRKLLYYLFFMLVLSSCSKDFDELNTLPPAVLWDKTVYPTHNFDGDSVINAISMSKYATENTADNGLVIAVNGYLDKYNSEGNRLFEKRFSGHVSGVQGLSNNEYLICGAKNSSLWVAKTDADWNILWEQSIATHTGKISVIEQAADGFVIAGFEANASFDTWILKLDNDGNLRWSKRFESDKLEIIRAVELTSDGSIFTVGEKEAVAGSSNLWLIRFDKDGNILWEKTEDLEEVYFGLGIQENSSGNLMVLGNEWIGTFSPTGTLLSSNETGDFSFLEKLPSGNMVGLGLLTAREIRLGGDGYSDYYVTFAKFNDKTERVWQLNLLAMNGSDGEATPVSVSQLTDGSYMVLFKGRWSSDYDDTTGFYRLVKVQAD